MKLKTTHAACVFAVFLVGCSDSVPSVADPHNITVNGEPMTQQAFLETFCAGKKDHETCLKVNRAMIQDSVKGKEAPPRF